MFSGCGVKRHEDFTDQDREDGEKMETAEQRKRLAAAGGVYWKIGEQGDSAAGAWVGSINTSNWAAGVLTTAPGQSRPSRGELLQNVTEQLDLVRSASPVC